jgi:hypothetical protein
MRHRAGAQAGAGGGAAAAACGVGAGGVREAGFGRVSPFRHIACGMRQEPTFIIAVFCGSAIFPLFIQAVKSNSGSLPMQFLPFSDAKSTRFVKNT